jgi:ribonucleoside-diphosphate reductase alpha chain
MSNKNQRPPGVRTSLEIPQAFPAHRKMPKERKGVTYSFKIFAAEPLGTVRGYLTVNEYPEGGVGEIFIKLCEQGSTVSGMCDAWAIAVSRLLQLGVPLESIVRKFKSMRFEPAGRTSDPEIHFCLSPMDFIARWLEKRYLSEEQ